MSTLTEEKTVGQIAAEHPASLRVFEKYGIDYCCGGKQPFEASCAGHGVTAGQIMQEIEAASAPAESAGRDWSTADLNDLIDHIIAKHHAYLKSELPRLSNLHQKVLAAHGVKHSDTLKPLGKTLAALREELEAHLMKEEMILFPMIRIHNRAVSNPILVMEDEHDSAGRALEQMRTLTNHYTLPKDACITYRALFEGLEQLEADLHQHIHLENNILFPRAQGTY